mmetsp:Transcript_25484/g.37603  ORF Transcript_25484/g.37603 Transcript_25484/m.37603 type:complete len:238 (+) Transcript_25484:68-781(+)
MDVENIYGNSPSMFSVGDLVVVEARTWPGINKLGGTGFIKSIDKNSNTYSVSYVLGGKEDSIEPQYISLKEDMDEKPERSRRPTSRLQPEVVTCTRVKKKAKVVSERTPKPARQPTEKVDCSPLELPVPAIALEKDVSFPEVDTFSDSISHAETDSACAGPATSSTLSDIAQVVVENFKAATRQCSCAADEAYSVADLETFFCDLIPNCTPAYVEEALLFLEDDNKLMLADGSVYVI